MVYTGGTVERCYYDVASYLIGPKGIVFIGAAMGANGIDEANTQAETSAKEYAEATGLQVDGPYRKKTYGVQFFLKDEERIVYCIESEVKFECELANTYY